MKNFFKIATLTLISFSALAQTSLTCKPKDDSGYFTEDMKIEVLSSTQIRVNNEKLTLDATYKPRTPTTFKRYSGDTEAASGWADSGAVEIFFNQKALRITVRGEMFIDEILPCTAN